MRGCSGRAIIEARTDELEEMVGANWDSKEVPVLSCGSWWVLAAIPEVRHEKRVVWMSREAVVAPDLCWRQTKTGAFQAAMRGA